MVLYLTVIGVNLLLFLVVFPLTANLKSSGKTVLGQTSLSSKTLRVEIPCPGHAPLIVDELKKTEGVIEVKYRLPNLFEVSYSSDETSLEEILNLEIFKTFKARGV